MAATFSVPGRRPLATRAEEDGGEPYSAAHEQRADTLGSVQLVARDGQEVHTETR